MSARERPRRRRDEIERTALVGRLEPRDRRHGAAPRAEDADAELGHRRRRAQVPGQPFIAVIGVRSNPRSASIVASRASSSRVPMPCAITMSGSQAAGRVANGQPRGVGRASSATADRRCSARADAEQLRQDGRAARLRAGAAFEHDERGAFGEHEAVTVPVERTMGPSRFARRQQTCALVGEVGRGRQQAIVSAGKRDVAAASRAGRKSRRPAPAPTPYRPARSCCTGRAPKTRRRAAPRPALASVRSDQ